MRALVWLWTVLCISLCTAAGAGAQTPASADATAADAGGVEVVFWQTIQNSTNPAEFEAYLEQFPNGVFRALAQARLATLSTPAASGSSPSSEAATSAARTRRESPLAGLLCDYLPGFPATVRYLSAPALPAMCVGSVYCSDKQNYIVACPANFHEGEYLCPWASDCGFSTGGTELRIEVPVGDVPDGVGIELR